VGQILNKGEKLIYSGQYEQASQTFAAAKKYFLRKARVLDAIAVSHLSMAQHSKAEEIFHDLKEKRLKSSTFDAKEILEFFLNHGDYFSVKIYGEHLQSWKKESELPFYLLLSYNGLNEIEKAETVLGDCKKIEALKKRVDFQENLLNEKKKDGCTPFLLDRKGKTLISTSLKDGHIINQAGYPEILENEPFLASFSEYDRRNRMILTIDLNAQKMAEEALDRYTGAFVAIEPDTGEIIAAYSSDGQSREGTGKKKRPRSQNQERFEGIRALEKTLEPGSIMKVITLAGAIDKGFDYSALFPFRCEGFLGIDETLFYDWIKHGELSNINEAMAVSCNIFFATVGMHLNEEHLNATLSAFGFDSSLSDFPLFSKLGSLYENTGTKINLFVANRSVGLGNIDLTALHAAMIASAFANDGKIMKPVILKEKQNIEMRGYFLFQPEILFQSVRSETALTIAEAMMNSVESEKGTSRRARIDGLKVALKTGTAGESSKGLDAWMIGFAPYENPEIAFCFVAEHAGKAEIAGAKIAKKFLTSYFHERLVPQN
jgi:peptidoglycan glycosyltransferase